MGRKCREKRELIVHALQSAFGCIFTFAETTYCYFSVLMQKKVWPIFFASEIYAVHVFS